MSEKKRVPVPEPLPKATETIKPVEMDSVEGKPFESAEELESALKENLPHVDVTVEEGEEEGQVLVTLETRPPNKEDLRGMAEKVLNQSIKPTGALAEHDPETLKRLKENAEELMAHEAPKEIQKAVSPGSEHLLDEADFGTGPIYKGPQTGNVKVETGDAPSLGEDEEEVFIMPQWTVMEMSTLWVSLLQTLQARGEYNGPIPLAFAGSIHEDGSVYLEAVDLPHNVVVVAPRAPRQFHPRQSQMGPPPGQPQQPWQQGGPAEAAPPEEPRRRIRTLCLSENGNEILDAGE